MAIDPARSARERVDGQRAPGGTVPEDDLDQRNLTDVAENDLTTEERHELERRFNDFVTRLRERAGVKTAEKKKPKRYASWDPAALSRRH
jgi:hypothetical protein